MKEVRCFLRFLRAMGGFVTRKWHNERFGKCMALVTVLRMGWEGLAQRSGPVEKVVAGM